MVNRITRSILVFVVWKDVKFQKTFQLVQNSRGFCLTCLRLNLIVRIKTMGFITFSTKHPICKTFLRLNRCLLKLKTKTLPVCLSEFCDHSRLLFIALHFQVIKGYPYQLQSHSLAAGSFVDKRLSRTPFFTKYISKKPVFSVFMIESEEK